MAKYDVTHSCGHTVEIEQCGKESDRRERREWLRTQPCLPCKRAADTAAAAETAEKIGLPTLTGSEKQVAWAETIRVKLAVEVAEIAQKRIDQWQQTQRAICAGNDVALAKGDALVLALEAVVRRVGEQASAKFWIDHRDNAMAAMKAVQESVPAYQIFLSLPAPTSR